MFAYYDPSGFTRILFSYSKTKPFFVATNQNMCNSVESSVNYFRKYSHSYGKI